MMTPYRRYRVGLLAASITGRKDEILCRVIVSGNSFIASSISEGVGLWRRRDLACDAWRGGRTAPGSKSNQIGFKPREVCFEKILRYICDRCRCPVLLSIIASMSSWEEVQAMWDAQEICLYFESIENF